MNILITILIFIFGLVLLVKSSSTTVSNAIKLSRLSGISQVAIGFILIAIATSLPELSIAVVSSFEGRGALSIGNLIGSNISNIALIFGLMAFVGFKISKRDIEEITQGIIIVSIIALFALIQGGIMLPLAILCLISFYVFDFVTLKEKYIIGDRIKFSGLRTIEIVKSIGLVLLGVALVITAAVLVTDSAIGIARFFGVSESLIGATILALGTTLPELSINLMAIKNRNIPLAIGDSIGSCVVNLTLIIGLAGLINPIIFNGIINTGLTALIIINCIFLFLASRMKFGKFESAILLSCYLAFLFFVLKAGF